MKPPRRITERWGLEGTSVGHLCFREQLWVSFSRPSSSSWTKAQPSVMDAPGEAPGSTEAKHQVQRAAEGAPGSPKDQAAQGSGGVPIPKGITGRGGTWGHGSADMVGWVNGWTRWS